MSHHGLTRDALACLRHRACGHQHQERQRHERTARVRTWPAPTARAVPSRTHSQANIGARMIDEDRRHRLEPATRGTESEELEARVAIGEEVQRRSRLLVDAPEQNRDDEEDRRSRRCVSTRPREKPSGPLAGDATAVADRQLRDAASAALRADRAPAEAVSCRARTASGQAPCRRPAHPNPRCQSTRCAR